MHYHIYDFCDHCGQKPWHVNTENLVSPQMSSQDVAEYFNYWKDGWGNDIYAILPCVDICLNPKQNGEWGYVPREHYLTKTFRPQHYLES